MAFLFLASARRLSRSHNPAIPSEKSARIAWESRNRTMRSIIPLKAYSSRSRLLPTSFLGKFDVS